MLEIFHNDFTNYQNFLNFVYFFTPNYALTGTSEFDIHGFQYHNFNCFSKTEFKEYISQNFLKQMDSNFGTKSARNLFLLILTSYFNIFLCHKI